MKIIYPKYSRPGGFATIVFITLLAIMFLLAAANTMALIRLHREVKLVEQNQIKRLNGPQANPSPAATPLSSNIK